MKKKIKTLLPVAVIFLIVLFAGTAFAAGEKISLTAENKAEGIYLEWNEADGAYYYEIYRQAGEKGKKLLLSKVQNTSYEDSDVKEGTAYKYTVIPSYSDYTTGEASNEVTVYRLAAVYISGAGSEKNGLYVKWNTVKNAKGYRVYRKNADDGEWASVAKLGAKVTKFVDEGISPGQNYTYCVKAYNGEYEGSAGNEKQLSYMNWPPVKSISIGEKGIKLDWDGSAEAIYFLVFRKADGEDSYSPVALLDSDYTEYEDKSVKPGKVYSYRICGADERGNLSYYDRELTLRYIRKSQITAAVNTAKGIKLYWNISEGCQGYGIFRKSSKEKEWTLRGVIYGENKLTAVDSKVNDNEVYTYTVRAFYNKTLAAYDDTGASIRFYAAPDKLTVKGNAKNGVTLTWTKSDTVKSYAVFRKSGDSAWQLMCMVSDGSFTDKSVKAKTEYTYAVEAYEGSVLHSGSSEVSITVK